MRLFWRFFRRQIIGLALVTLIGILLLPRAIGWVVLGAAVLWVAYQVVAAIWLWTHYDEWQRK